MTAVLSRLLVFVKAPRPGEVKTRLGVVIGASAAARLYRALAERVLARTRPENGAYERVLVFAPPDAEDDVRSWLPGETCERQADGDLGVRMASAFDRAFAEGASRVILIGTDAPDLSREHVQAALAALAALAHQDLVLGPSTDGGYYLVGLRGPCPRLFEDVRWSTPSVLGETLTRARELGLRVHLLAPLSDIDTLADLRQEWVRIRRWLPETLARELERWI